jgi:uncharacterized repeat protein (TIGR02543 family)
MSTVNKVSRKTVLRSSLVAPFAILLILSTLPMSTSNASTPLFHAVTFVENDTPNDPVYSSQTANVPTALTPFADLNPSFVNSGFSFVDWNSSPDGTGTSFANSSTYSFATAEVLYAVWVGSDHAVTFVENDSPNDPVYATQTENAPEALTLFANLNPALSNPGFSFVDWNTESNGSGISYGDGSTYSFAGAIDLFAIWSTIPTTTVNFENIGGTGSTGSVSNYVGESIALPSGSGMSNPGYTFAGWNTEADGSGTEYAAGATYVFTANQTLYAQWSPDTYTVTYSYDGGAVSLVSSAFVVGSVALILPTPTFAGNTFYGWFNAETGGALIGAGGTSYIPTGSTELFAQWSPMATDVLMFNSNGGSGSTPSLSGEDGTSATLPAGNGFTLSGFAFSGWNSQANGSGTQYAEGASFVLDGSQTLYAQWTAGPSATVTFNANGGSGSIDPIVGSPGSTITLPDQTGMLEAGFELLRWNTSATGSGTSYSIGEAFKISGSEVLYAQWSGHKLATLFGAVGTFKKDSSTLSAALKKQINRIAITIKSRKYAKVDLFGYTSATGLKSLNVILSRARARNVASYLRNRLHDMKVRGVTVFSTGEGAIAGQTSNSYSRVEVFGV